MANLSNSEKARHGRSAHVGMEEILKRCVDAGYLAQVSKNYGIGKPGYKNDKQFYAPFLVVFMDESKWAIFTTTSWTFGGTGLGTTTTTYAGLTGTTLRG